MTVIVRLATSEDIPAIVPIACESQNKHAQAYPDLFRPDTPGFTVEYMQSLLEDDTRAIYVAELDGRIIGYALLRMSTLTFLEVFYPRRVAHIHDIAVSEACQRQGVGRMLFEHCTEWARDHHADNLELTVWEFNTQALAFYERLGMQTQNRTMSLPLAR